ncbi:MAG: hypothetical protein AB1449_04740 [Chloroflexota bacterium]
MGLGNTALGRRAPALRGALLAVLLTGCAGSGLGATATPEPTATIPSEVSLQPAAFLAVDPAYGLAMLWTLDHHLLAVFPDVTWENPAPGTGVVAGSLTDPAKSLPFAFLESGEGEWFVTRHGGGEAVRWISLDSPSGMAGSIPGGHALVGDRQQGRARLYLLDLRQPQPSPSPTIVWQGHGPPAIPVALRLAQGRPVEGLFSLATQAGGLPAGLYSIQLETGDTSAIVASELTLLGVAPDLTWYAVSDPTAAPPQVEIRRYDGSSSVVFQPTSGARAVGRAVFSPEGRNVAWATVVPLADDPERTVINVVSTSGGVPTSITPEQVRAQLSDEIGAISPAAWLDEHTLLIQAEVGGEPQVLRIGSDGFGVQPAGQGIFISLVYR